MDIWWDQSHTCVGKHMTHRRADSILHVGDELRHVNRRQFGSLGRRHGFRFSQDVEHLEAHGGEFQAKGYPLGIDSSLVETDAKQVGDNRRRPSALVSAPGACWKGLVDVFLQWLG